LDRAITAAEAAEDDSVVVEPGAVLGEGVRIGRGSRIGANTVIGQGVQIGRDCVIGSNVTVGFALIGDRVKLYAGARIGEAGFGATGTAAGAMDIPQLGRVILQDGVTVGANSCIDRGAYDDTVIGENTKIDNLVMVGHNCVIGRNNLMAANTGISGSVTSGDNVIFGGKAGIGDHITIGVAAGAGVLANIPAGETWSGYPARPIRQFLRETIWLAKQASSKKAPKES
jgi:UDP-3-O-[3-hydroxymyristoyl] glucosamine N-acyltransferase